MAAVAATAVEGSGCRIRTTGRGICRLRFAVATVLSSVGVLSCNRPASRVMAF